MTSSSCKRLSTLRVERPSRSSRCTSNSSPSRRTSSTPASPDRPSREAPEPVAARMISQPAAFSFAFWISMSRLDGLTRAHPDPGHGNLSRLGGCYANAVTDCGILLNCDAWVRTRHLFVTGVPSRAIWTLRSDVARSARQEGNDMCPMPAARRIAVETIDHPVRGVGCKCRQHMAKADPLICVVGQRIGHETQGRRFNPHLRALRAFVHGCFPICHGFMTSLGQARRNFCRRGAALPTCHLSSLSRRQRNMS